MKKFSIFLALILCMAFILTSTASMNPSDSFICDRLSTNGRDNES